jgi:hypothetical protein
LGHGISKTFKNQHFHERICDYRGDYFISAKNLRTMNIYIYIDIYSWFTLDEEVGWLMQKKIYIDHEEGKVARRHLKLLQSNS